MTKKVSKKNSMENSNCYCGRKKSFDTCCNAIHKNHKLAETAEDLMRSRYVAFVEGNGSYLQNSHHTNTRPSAKESIEIENWAKSVSWIKLEVLNTISGQINDSKGTVEFKAYFLENGKVEVIHENSFFEKEKGVWKYKCAF